MAKVSNREDALLNAYMTRYKNAQAGTVSEGQRNTSTARARGAAILNATDKTLPALKDTYSDTLSGIVQGASLENSLTNDILDRNLKLAKARFDQANDLNEQLQKAQQYAEKQAAKAAKSSGKRSGKSSGKSGSSASSDADAAASLEDLFGDTDSGETSSPAKPTAASADSKSKADTKKTREKSGQEKYLEAKKAGAARTTQAKTYAERNGTGSTATTTSSSTAAARQSSGKGTGIGTQGESFQKAAKAVVGALTAPARVGNDDDKKSQYQKRQLVDSGRAFTKDGKVNQRYTQLENEDTERKTAEKSGQRSVGSRAADLVKGVGKQAAGAILSFLEAPAGGGSEANKQAQHDMRMLMENGLAMNADGSTSDAYQKALNRFENTKNDQDVLDEKFVPALKLVNEGNAQVQRGGEGLTGFGKGAYNVAAMGANMVPGMALGLVNPALGAGYMGLTAAGNKVAEDTEKGMGSRDALLRGAASGLISTGTNSVPIGEFANITKNGSPILQAALKEGVENAGQEAADYLLNTAADYALKDPDASFSLQDMAGQVGMGAATGAAFGALGGVLNRAGNRAGLLDNGRQDEAFLRKDALPEETFAPDASSMEQSAVPQGVPAAIAQERIAQQTADTGRTLPVQSAAEAAQSVPTADAAQSMSGAQQASQSAVVPRSTGTAYMPDNTPVNYRWAAVDANDLVASNDALGSANPAYPKEYQNRNRDSAASMQQITRMANDLNPARLADSANIGDGSPVIRGDNVVLSGNGRTAAIQTAYRDGKAGNYRNYVASHAAEYGIDPATLPENPVLVRVADDDTDMLKLARGANESTTASFGAAENAVNYGQKVTASNAMSRYNPEKSITDLANNSAVAGLLRDIVPESEYNRVVTKDGKVSLDGYKTAKDAMFSAAYGNSDRLQILAEGGDDSSRNITAAMRDSAANAITLKQMVERGELPQEFDVTNDVSGAADLYAYVKSGNMGKGKTVADYVAGLTQGEDGRFYDGFDEVPYSQMSMYIAEIMEDNRRSGKATTEYLNYLYDSAKQGEGGELTLEGTTNVRTRQDIIEDATGRFYQAAGRSDNGKAAPDVPFTGEGWANTVAYHPADAAENQGAQRAVAGQARVNTAPTADAGGAAALPGQNKQSTAERPLNGSESVPAHAVGAESTQYDRREVLNQDYANQRTMRGDMDGQTAAELGIGEQTHTVYSRAEGRDTAAQDFDVLVQQTGSVTEAGRTVADELNRKIQDGHWDAADVYAGSHAADQLRQRLAELPEGSAEADVVKAQIANLNRAVSAGQSKAGQALVSGRYAQPDEYSGIRRFEQYTQDSVDRFSHTRQGQQLHEVAQDVADTLNGPMDDEFTAFIHEQGIDTGDNVRDQLEYMADQIQRMGRAHNVDINEEQARAAAARAQAGGTVEDIYGAFARQALGIGDLSQEDLDYAVDTFRRIADMPDSRERYDLEMSVYNRMANYMPARGFADRLNNIRYLCMLGNTRTHIRNVMGNVMMGTVVRAKDNVAGMMQLALPENQRTKAVGTTLTADGRQMVNRAREYADRQMYTVLFQDGRWNMDTGLQAARNTYTTPIGRAIGRLSDINGGALEAEDNFFLRSEFGNSMASFLKARGYDSSIFDATDEHSRTVLRQAAAQALADAREATFHEDNFLSTAFRNFSSDTRQHGPAGQLAYAVTEGILPFKKTPINIAKNALEYNPIGGTVEAIYRGATGQGATRVMDAAAKGVTGTAILGAGYLLAKNGMLTGGGSGDDRADAYKEMTGEQNYAVKIPGKGTYTLDWASPASVPLLIGAQIAQDQEDGGEFNLTQTLDRFRQITQPVLETTMLQGLNDTLDSVSYADSNDKLATLATSALGSFANQFVPTALGQVARTVDDTRRSTYGGGDTKTERDVNYNIRKMENKIPGLSMNNEPYIDQWGREEASLDGADDTAGGMFLRGAYNMLSPGYVSAENVTPVDEYLQGLYDTTGDSTVLPEKAKSYLTLDGEKAYMTPEQKTQYAKTAGQTSYDIVDALRNESMFLKLPEYQQAEIVSSAYSVAKTAGGVEAVGDGVSGTNTKAYKAYEQGGTDGVVNYLLAKNAIDVASGDSDSITGAEKWTAISSAMDEDAAAEQYVLQQGTDSVAGRVYSYAGSNGLNAYMDAYSKVAAGLDEGKSPSRKDMSVALLKSGLSSDELAKTYLSAYKDDAKAASAYSSYGADGLKGWLQYYNAADLDGNGSVTQKEAQATLDQMDLTEQLKAAYWQMTNKSWKASKNPY